MFMLICAVILGGCISTPDTPTPRFYTLRPVSNEESGQKFNTACGEIIGFGPVNIPEYLNRPQIVTLNKDRTLKFAQFDRWGDSLDLMLERLLCENLTVMLAGTTIESFPWSQVVPVRYQVAMDVIHLEGELDKNLALVVQWSIIDLEQKKMLLTKRSQFVRPINPKDYFGFCEALSVECIALSKEIAEAISSLAK
jgi:uncharacterized lipoprotein YmbA